MASHLNWVTCSGLLATLGENQPINFQLVAIINGSIIVKYQNTSADDRIVLQEAGLAISDTGLIYGQASVVDSSNPNYILKSSLPQDIQNEFPNNVRGYIDYEFSIDAIADGVTESRTFIIRVLDYNKPPSWLPELNTIDLNDIYPSNYFNVSNSVNIDFLNDIHAHVIDPDGDTLNWNVIDSKPRLLTGSLPDGLTLNNNGTITGILESFPRINDILTKTYQFVIRVFDGSYYIDKAFVVTITRTTNTSPVWSDSNSPDYSIRAMASFETSQPVLFNVQATDDDNDDLTYTLSEITEPAPEESSTKYRALPKGITFSNGQFKGVIHSDNPPGEYYFQVNVTDGFVTVSRVFYVIIFAYNPFAPYIPITNIEWVTPSGLLGILKETYPSYFTLKATSNFDTNIFYELTEDSDPLPPGLALDSATGNIYGRVAYVTEDATYEFKVRAYLVNSPTVFQINTFSIEVEHLYSDRISSVKCPVIGELTQKLSNFIGNSNLLLDDLHSDYIFRSFDINYGIKTNFSMYILTGMPFVSSEEVYETIKDNLPNTEPSTWDRQDLVPVQNYHRDKIALLGDLKTAVARDHLGEVIYEVVYIDVYDPSYRAGGFDNGSSEFIPYNAFDSSKPQNPNEIFPSSILNWRDDLKDNLGMLGDERLPLWMLSQQIKGDDASILGYIPAIELMFLKPGTAKDILSSTEIMTYAKEIKNQKLFLDRYEYEYWLSPDSIYARWFKFPPGNIH